MPLFKSKRFFPFVAPWRRRFGVLVMTRLTPKFAAAIAMPASQSRGAKVLHEGVSVITILAMVGFSIGCEVNRSDIHTALSPSEMSTAVRESLHRGMSFESTWETCEQLDLKATRGTRRLPGEDHPRRSLRAVVKPPGIQLTGGYAPIDWGSLEFLFAEEIGLDFASYSGPFSSRSSDSRDEVERPDRIDLPESNP
jgi:hypothetical protein